MPFYDKWPRSRALYGSHRSAFAG